MKVFFLFLISFLIVGCMETLDAPVSKEISAQKKIQNNKTEAQKAKEAYLRLQKQRNNE